MGCHLRDLSFKTSKLLGIFILLPQANGCAFVTLRSTHPFDGWVWGAPICLKGRFIRQSSLLHFVSQ